MTLILPIGGDDAARRVLDAAEAHFERTIAALEALVGEISAGDTARAKDLGKALGDLGKATQTAFDERSRVAKRISSESGVVHDYALDLDAARAEIGRRLACLGGAGGTAGVSEGAE